MPQPVLRGSAKEANVLLDTLQDKGLSEEIPGEPGEEEEKPRYQRELERRRRRFLVRGRGRRLMRRIRMQPPHGAARIARWARLRRCVAGLEPESTEQLWANDRGLGLESGEQAGIAACHRASGVGVRRRVS